jgi:SAM-dependent methyltransferase
LEHCEVIYPSETEIKRQVQEFYDHVGWKMVSESCYQNARYEDLRPVVRGYIHRCHMRVARHLEPVGRYLLDAGSGPIQYPEYLEYSRGYKFRVCADISRVALMEARSRIEDHGLYVVADIANLPFKGDVFEGLVSLHTIHHLPSHEHLQAYQELYRVLAPTYKAVVVNGWSKSAFMSVMRPLIYLTLRFLEFYRRMTGRHDGVASEAQASNSHNCTGQHRTFVSRHDAKWLQREVAPLIPLRIFVWRSVSTSFLRTMIHPRLGGRWLLSILFWMEERFPSLFGRFGQYPLIVIRKAQESEG